MTLGMMATDVEQRITHLDQRTDEMLHEFKRESSKHQEGMEQSFKDELAKIRWEMRFILFPNLTPDNSCP